MLNGLWLGERAEIFPWSAENRRGAGMDREANVPFVRKGNRMEVNTADTGAYGGMRAYFDAEYWLVEPLDAKAQGRW